MTVVWLVVVAAICAGSLVGYVWLGRTATPGQQAMEGRIKTMRWSFWRAVTGRARGSNPDVWDPVGSVSPVPEPEEHKQGWRPVR
ncbi:MAG: hypothetical protein M3063_15835 [Actinomycetota bacterium]|nr:hypothetical protein [Actinomycetota bacterium]